MIGTAKREKARSLFGMRREVRLRVGDREGGAIGFSRMRKKARSLFWDEGSSAISILG
ncbi:hypothetical protein [Halothece sp. PCC 7418]|uniref:hypothetical protein n=1 Tax=Halothece sp. (strain PCC 7418) TaxID=65093 RepID=UPI0014946EAC|nr:hypothetical protein [Halothece sp. PCC 7418]